jgi:hypothetical protein
MSQIHMEEVFESLTAEELVVRREGWPLNS